MLEYFTEESRKRNGNTARTIMKQQYRLMLRNSNTIESEIARTQNYSIHTAPEIEMKCIKSLAAIISSE